MFVFSRRQNRVFNYLMEYLCLLLYSQKIHTNASLITFSAHVGLFPQSLVMSSSQAKGPRVLCPLRTKCICVWNLACDPRVLCPLCSKCTCVWHMACEYVLMWSLLALKLRSLLSEMMRTKIEKREHSGSVVECLARDRGATV